VLLPRRLDVNVQAEQTKSAEAPFANVDGGSEATTACFSRLLLLSLALQRRAGGEVDQGIPVSTVEEVGQKLYDVPSVRQ